MFVISIGLKLFRFHPVTVLVFPSIPTHIGNYYLHLIHMHKVIAYGPEILSLEPHFNGSTIILNDFHRFFVELNGSLYCNCTRTSPSWMAARLYELTNEELDTLEEIYPDNYSQHNITIETRNKPFPDEIIVYHNPSIESKPPYTNHTDTAYTLFENLSIAISSAFASKFALSTHTDLSPTNPDILTSYYAQLDEIDLQRCRRKILGDDLLENESTSI